MSGAFSGKEPDVLRSRHYRGARVCCYTNVDGHTCDSDYYYMVSHGKFRWIEVSNSLLNSVERVLPATPWHPRLFSTERTLRRIIHPNRMYRILIDLFIGIVSNSILVRHPTLYRQLVLDIVSKVPIYRNIERVLRSIPWHPRVFYADTEWKLRCMVSKHRNRIYHSFPLFIGIVYRTRFSFDILCWMSYRKFR